MNSFFARRYVVTAIFVTLCLTLLVRLFYMQIVEDKYFLASNNNVIRKFIMYPARGPILDRNNKILVQNEPVYDITVVPRQVKAFDTLAFCKMIGIDKEGFDKRFNKALKYSPYRTSIFEKQLPATLYASLQEKLSEFPGFDVQPRTIRTYPDSIAAHFLGYIGEVTDRDIEKSHGYYHPGDYIGRTGVEKAYEDLLRGQRGVKNLMVDSRNVAKGHFANGAYDTVAVAGKRLISSLDSRIQKLGEKLMKNKVGSIVAIEPSTGEILAFVSSPGYDPNLMVGRERGNNVAKLYEDPYNPLFIRPIQAYYPPGSSFKPLSALIALQQGIITPQTTYFCAGGYWAGNHMVKCTHHHGTTDLTLGIAGSCNVYFCSVFDKLMNEHGGKQTEATFTDWKAKVNLFGFGVKLGVDLPHEGRGNVPTALHYDNIHGKNHWRSSAIISLAIGQGELEATPLQLANVECTIANHGFYYTPHLIKSIGDSNIIKKEFIEKHQVGIDPQYFEPVIEGMHQVVQQGTARGSMIPGIDMCGKTGTAQNPHGKNHSLFVAFAPRNNPKIAIAVIVENSGDGGTWAAPIASFIVEKYLRDSITNRPSGITPKYYADANLLPPLPGQKPVVKPNRKLDTLGKENVDTTGKPPVQIKAVSHKNKNKKDTLLRILAAAQIKRKDDEQ
ncbi:penicillin-binding protein 2 [Mucilaginibacter polytrichastri]|uniref:Penicillin-binding protein 2 n=1 Tax=Mucilaginibacter polytrichastri TaxID=1302689 RepID=A0A1Q5ZSP5_9SPHI|nr:penicillin-binding protein 2 [Mucilaginibacter polytrichastri]OKS84795.1 hypothetical protein RG47T_0228 [Mucilaginibacter polytrichastri]SFT00181.1 penicillin-binding protein 2 [Mucilaginibacter polytrichastri]